MIIKRFEPFSCAKVSGILYAVMGFLIGIIFSLVSLVAGSLYRGEDAPTA